MCCTLVGVLALFLFPLMEERTPKGFRLIAQGKRNPPNPHSCRRIAPSRNVLSKILFLFEIHFVSLRHQHKKG